MIALLRAGTLLVNAGVAFGLPILFDVPLTGAAGIAFLLAALSWWGCGRAPRGADAAEEIRQEAFEVAALLDTPPPQFVRALPGWTAAVVRAPGGYGLLMGRDVAKAHRQAVMAHELAHVRTGDLAWEPLTDGPIRLVAPLIQVVPPLAIAFAPLCIFGVPLARATELRADRVASARVPSYPRALQEFASSGRWRPSFLYPSLGKRLRVLARAS